jgi:hypothetical protein
MTVKKELTRIKNALADMARRSSVMPGIGDTVWEIGRIMFPEAQSNRELLDKMEEYQKKNLPEEVLPENPAKYERVWVKP